NGKRTWLKTKCLNREEFVVVGYSDPEGTRHAWFVAAWLLHAGRQVDLRRSRRHWAVREGAGRAMAEASTAGHRQDVARRTASSGEPVRIAAGLSRVHWVRPEMVVEVSYLTWSEDGLLRQVSRRAGGQASR